ncbi:MAG: xanthine dehydrogenase family protein molybdopterin-binding subunit [Pseudomonadota bacterium]
MTYVGQSMPGRNNERLVQGRGQFTADVQLPNQCWLALVRSPYAQAKIKHIDLEAARALPGVVDILTGEEVAEESNSFGRAMGPEDINLADMGGKPFRQYALATDWVGYSGRPVVAIAAEDRYTAAKAAELIDIDYEELPVVSDAKAALSPDSPPAIPGWQDNLVFHNRYAKGEANTALEQAHGTLRGTVKVQRHVPVPLEPRAFVGDYDIRSGRLTMWASTQMPHTDRSLLAGCLGMVSEDIHVIQPDVGGGFGCKSPGSDEEILVAIMTRRLGRPVRWSEERAEYFLACGHARETEFDFEVGYSEDGRLTALKVDVTADIGMPQGAWVQSYVTSFCIPCAYVVDDCEVNMRAAVTNKCKWGGYRGFGKEVASFFMDRVLDRVADATGLDRTELRMKNFVPADAFPYEQVSGALLDSGNYQGAMTQLVEALDIESFRIEQAEARQAGRFIGLGVGFELTPEGCSLPNNDFLQGWDGVTVRMDPMGRVTVLTGVTSPGSGNETGIAQIVADTLGVEIESINVVQGDTDRCPYGLGNYSSRSLMIGGSAAMMAAEDIRDKLLKVASNILEVDPDDLEAADGVILAKGVSDLNVPIKKVARMIYRNAFGAEAEEVEPGLDVTRYFRIGNVYHQPEKQGRFSACRCGSASG